MQAPTWQELSANVARRSRAAGLDLVQPFAVHWYNDAVPEPHRLPAYEREPCLGLLIGNTRALWPRFLARLRAEPERLLDDDPLDAYVEAAIGAALRDVPYAWEGVWAHGSRRLAVQQLAQRAGLAYLSPGRLSVHPTFGPWIGLRAAVVVDRDGPPGPPPAVPAPCADCEVRCQPAFARAAATLAEPVDQAAVTPHWRLWLAARDACPIGRVHRFDEAQIGYHYTKDRAFLRQALAAVP